MDGQEKVKDSTPSSAVEGLRSQGKDRYADERLFERLLSDLSTRFISLPAEEIDQEIVAAQRRVCEHFNLELSPLWQWHEDTPNLFVLTHLYRPLGGPPIPESMDAQEYFPWIRQQVVDGRVTAISSLDELPPGAARDKESLRHFGVKTALVYPLSAGGGPSIGAMSFHTVREERGWPESIVNQLQLVAQFFANALVRKQADRALRESEARLSLAADSANLGLWVLDFKTDKFWVSETSRTLFGFAPDEEVSFERFLELVHPEDIESVRQVRQEMVKSTADFRIEYRIARPDGALRWMASQGRSHFSAKGEPERLMGVSMDITERRLAEEALEESEEINRATFEQAAVGIAHVGIDGRFMRANDKFCAMLGYERAELMKLTFQEITHPEDLESHREFVRQVLAGDIKTFSIDKRYIRKDQSTVWANLTGSLVRDGAGRPRYFISVVKDITDHKKMEKELKSQLHEIEELEKQLEQENLYLREESRALLQGGPLVGNCPALRAVMTQVQQVAPTDSTVLLLGETGTGKGLVAQVIHDLSPRKARIMVKVDCASIPSALIESELFGREKGAYTGALTSQIGRFESANGSTIFLDEIGELSPELQAKLLRFVQDAEFERLGSSKTIRSDVRVIAATNRNLLKEVKEGRFREDLYYRLSVFPIHVPPLRERIEDIPLLVQAFANEFSSRMRKKVSQVPRRVLEGLQRYQWPGNVRELRNVIERAFILTEGDVLNVRIPDRHPEKAPAPTTLQEADTNHILSALEACHWRIKGPHGAARLLGLKPSTLYTKMSKLGIPTRRAKDGKQT